MCSISLNVLFIIERVVSSDSRNSIHDTGEHHTKRTCLSEKNIIDECVEKNANSLYCSAEEETSESGNELALLESSDSDSNSDSDFER